MFDYLLVFLVYMSVYQLYLLSKFAMFRFEAAEPCLFDSRHSY